MSSSEKQKQQAEMNKRYIEMGKSMRDFGDKCMKKGFKPQAVCIADSMRFGRRRRYRKCSRKGKKLPKAFVRKCQKYGVKTTIKRGKKRIQKKMSVLKKQLRRAMRSRRCRR
jgi:hypothetical protein